MTRIKQSSLNLAHTLTSNKTDKTKGLISNQMVFNTEDLPQQHSLMLAVVPLCETEPSILFNKLT